VDAAFLDDFDAWAAEYEEMRSDVSANGVPLPDIDDQGLTAYQRRILAVGVLEGMDRETYMTRVADFADEATIAGTWDTAARIAMTDSQGVAGEVIFADFACGVMIPFTEFGRELRIDAGKKSDRCHEVAGAKAYNRWLADFCSEAAGLRAGVIQIRPYDMEETLEEVRRGHDSGLFGGVQLPLMDPDCGVPSYNDPRYEALWIVCEELGLPINNHVAPGPMELFARYGSDPHQTVMLSLYDSFTFTRRPFLFMLVAGVFESHPDLKVVFTESLADWVAPWLRELDSHFTELRWQAGYRNVNRLKPSEYFKRQCYVGGSFMARHEALDIVAGGFEDCAMFGVDFPHAESTWPDTYLNLQDTFGGLDQGAVSKVLGGNAMRLFSFDEHKVLSVASRVGPFIEDFRETLPDDKRPMWRGPRLDWDHPWPRISDKVQH
jgi:predicted TIM-barrel fold metal-dependent hydrolase